MTTPRTLRTAALFAVSTAILHGTAHAGRPLICRRYHIGTEASLPWSEGGDRGRPQPGYPRARLVADTLRLLSPRLPVLARMETLRRATAYVDGHSEVARELVLRLATRVLDAEASGTPDPLAWFDAGYLVASLDQAQDSSSTPRLGDRAAGYAWVTRALERTKDPTMEYAAALIQYESPAKPGPHLTRAYEGARTDVVLARNLAASYPQARPLR